jgi:hypothetical protein
MTKQETLKVSHQARVEEVLNYQINIDNFRLALQEVERRNDPDLEAFREQLEGLLASSILEQKKAQIMLDVIASQLE